MGGQDVSWILNLPYGPYGFHCHTSVNPPRAALDREDVSSLDACDGLKLISGKV